MTHDLHIDGLEARTASLEARLAQTLDDLDIARKTVHEVNEWRKEIGAAFFDLTLQYNDQAIELKRVTDVLNERTLQLNNIRQFYRNTDAELDRMRAYTRQVTQEKAMLQSQLTETNAAGDRALNFCISKDGETIRGLQAAHNELWDERNALETERNLLQARVHVLTSKLYTLATAVVQAETLRLSVLEQSEYIRKEILDNQT